LSTDYETLPKSRHFHPKKIFQPMTFTIFKIVAAGLEKTGNLTGLSYNEINILVYYFLLPIGVGWFPEFMQKPVWADMNLAYLFALSQFFMSWALAFVYVVAAAGWDRRETALLANFGFTSKH
jgi:uncharacterized membrane protein (DUF485 family)